MIDIIMKIHFLAMKRELIRGIHLFGLRTFGLRNVIGLHECMTSLSGHYSKIEIINDVFFGFLSLHPSYAIKNREDDTSSNIHDYYLYKACPHILYVSIDVYMEVQNRIDQNKKPPLKTTVQFRGVTCMKQSSTNSCSPEQATNLIQNGKSK